MRKIEGQVPKAFGLNAGADDVVIMQGSGNLPGGLHNAFDLGFDFLVHV